MDVSAKYDKPAICTLEKQCGNHKEKHKNGEE